MHTSCVRIRYLWILRSLRVACTKHDGVFCHDRQHGGDTPSVSDRYQWNWVRNLNLESDKPSHRHNRLDRMRAELQVSSRSHPCCSLLRSFTFGQFCKLVCSPALQLTCGLKVLQPKTAWPIIQATVQFATLRTHRINEARLSLLII